MQAVPGPTKRAATDDVRGNRGIGSSDCRFDDVDAILVLKGGVGTFPGCDAAAAVTKEDLR